MRVIKDKPIEAFCDAHPEATEPFGKWAEKAEEHHWRNWAELKASFPSADLYGSCVVFDVGGNKYRLIGKVHYSRLLEDGRWGMGRIYVRAVLTHKEYDKGNWKDDCEG